MAGTKSQPPCKIMVLGCPFRRASNSREVVPAELRHKLWLQFCFNDLGGLGQEDELTLEDPEEHYRIERFIDDLRECKDAVAFFGLTLESMLTRLVLPEKDRPIFLELMQGKAGPGIASANRLPTACNQQGFLRGE